MPTYDYLCVCGKAQDLFVQHCHPPETLICACGEMAKRQIGCGSAVMFLGPGWSSNRRMDHEKKFVVSAKPPEKRE
jgi:predicted nucleic acid-binding Zn ribbon protein